MTRLIITGLVALTVAACGGGQAGQEAATTSAEPAATSEATQSVTPEAASGCLAGGLDAMTALSDFQLEMDEAQKAGKITLDQLLAARDTLYNQTQAAYDTQDWAGYCGAIDSTREELGL